MAMGRPRNTELDRAFSEAESCGSCLVLFDHTLRNALHMRTKTREALLVAPRVYVRTAYWNSLSKRNRMLHLIRALQALHPEWVFCHESAAAVYGLPTAASSLVNAHVVVPRASRWPSTKCIQRHAMPEDRIVDVDGIRVTSLERTAFDCMRKSDFATALAIADAALRLHKVARADLLACFKTFAWKQPGACHAMRTLLFADPRSESPGESIARAAMIEGGFVMPDLQVEIPRPLEPWRTYRPDFRWEREDGTQVLGEFDGVVKYEDSSMRDGRSTLQVLADERKRESQLSVYGMPIVRFGWKDVMDRTAFWRLLKLFGIPQRDEFADEIMRLMKSRSVSAKMFFCVPL